jgi:hypothetical protein
MSEQHKPSSLSAQWADGRLLLLLLASINFLFHVLISPRYGSVPDELYYVDCARHLAWGYEDHPPLTVATAWLLAHTIGTSLYALRLLPALASGILVWITGALAREMGGRRFAQGLAAAAVMAAPVYMVVHHWLTTNAFETTLWMACAWCVVRATNRDDPRYWVWFGVLAGIALENKYSVLFFLLGIIVGLIATKERKFFRSKWFWLGVGVALLLFLPNFLWEAHRHFPFLEHERDARQSWGRGRHGYLGFLIVQALITNPVVAGLWAIGGAWLLRATAGRRYRILGITFVVELGTLMLLHGRDYYVTPIYPMVIAAGCVALESWTAINRRWLRPAYAGLVVLTGLLLAPVIVPVLSLPNYVKYQQALGVFMPKALWPTTKTPIPLYLGPEIGWEPMVRQVAAIYNALPPEQQKVTAIYATYYPEAAVIDFYGGQYGLPKAISPHQSFWLWGPREYDGSSMIILGSDAASESAHCASVKEMGRVDMPTPTEHYQILLCQGGTPDLQQRWPGLRNWFDGKPLKSQPMERQRRNRNNKWNS